jgi:hypothetical protein
MMVKVESYAGEVPVVDGQLRERVINETALEVVLGELRRNKQFFSITYRKKSGQLTERGGCQLGVKKHLSKNTNGQNTNYKSSKYKKRNDDLVIAFVQGMGYRSFIKDNIEKIESGTLSWERL